MTDASLPARYESPSAIAFLGYALGLTVIFWSLAGAGFSIEKVMTAPPVSRTSLIAPFRPIRTRR